MHLKYSFEKIDMGDEIILIPIGKGSDIIRGVLKLNKEGCEIIELLKQETNEDKIVNILEAQYTNDRLVLNQYVHDVVMKLDKLGIIEYNE